MDNVIQWNKKISLKLSIFTHFLQIHLLVHFSGVEEEEGVTSDEEGATTGVEGATTGAEDVTTGVDAAREIRMRTNTH